MSRTRRVMVAAAAVVVGLVGVFGVIAWRSGEPGVDGSFVLEEPGIYSEPLTTSNVAGSPLPDVMLTDAAGTEVSLASFAGKPLVVNVWYSSCPPCATELAAFAEVSDDHSGHIQFVGVNPQDDAATMTDFAEARGVEYPLLRDEDLAWVSALPVVTYPTTLFVSADGQILRQTNALDKEELQAAIADVF